MMALYVERQLTTRKSTALDTYFRCVPIVMGKVTIPMGQILSPVNPMSGASMGHSFSLSSSICWYASRYSISAKLPLSTITRLVVKPAMFMVMTSASSWGWWVPLASSSLKEIIWSSKRIFLGGRWMTKMLCTWHAYAFLEVNDIPPIARPPMMVLISPIAPGFKVSVRSFGPWAFGRRALCGQPTYFWSFPCRISVSTCSFNAMQFLVRWPWSLWKRQYRFFAQQFGFDRIFPGHRKEGSSWICMRGWCHNPIFTPKIFSSIGTQNEATWIEPTWPERGPITLENPQNAAWGASLEDWGGLTKFD